VFAKQETVMLFHASIAVADPQRVARVVAELWGGQIFPFSPGVGNSWMVIADDDRGTGLEVYPHGHLLKQVPEPGATLKTDLPRESATHVALGTILSREQVLAIGKREGWNTYEKRRVAGGGFNVIEMWAENTTMFEVLPKTALEEYLKSTRSESWANWIEANKAKAKAAAM
jgi:hypothetical protein